jgi:hypothetical protein
MKRRSLPLSTLDHDASPIAAALGLWRAARPARGVLPARGAFELGRLAARLDGTGWVKVVAERPARFRFDAVPPTATAPLHDLAAISRHGDALREAARPVYDDYAAAAFTGAPFLHHLLPGDDEAEHTVERLILPFADDGIGVDRLLVCARRCPPQILH